MISFLNLKYFLHLAEELNFNTTAKKLNITQQSLSGHIQKLEDYLGVELFKYGPPLRITPAGLLLKEHALDILERERILEADMLEIKKSKSGTINIGCTYARAQYMLPPIIREFQKKYPLIKINLLEGNTPQIEKALSQGLVNITVGFKPEKIRNLISVPLYHDPFMLVVHPSVLAKHFPSRKTDSFRFYNEQNIKDIIQHCPFLTMSIGTTVGKIGREYISKLQLDTSYCLELKAVGTMLSMCFSGMGYILCPRTLIQRCPYQFSKEHIIHPLPHHEPLLISINYPKAKAQSSIIKTFIKITQETLKADTIFSD